MTFESEDKTMISHIQNLSETAYDDLGDRKFNFVHFSFDDYVCFDHDCYTEILKHFRILGSPGLAGKAVVYNAEAVRLIYEKGHARFYEYSEDEKPGAIKPEIPVIPPLEIENEDELRALALKIAIGRARKRFDRENAGNFEPLEKKARLGEPSEEEIQKELVELKERRKNKKPPFETPLMSESDWLIPTDEYVLPTDPEFGTRYTVYQELWSRGFFVTSGSKFGSDFLVYDGQPGVVHSSYMCIIRAGPEAISVGNLMMLSRLARSVKKTVLIAIPGTDITLFMTLSQWNEAACGQGVPKPVRLTREDLELERKLENRPQTWDDMKI
uniref:tRNA-intron lyase n=1 Tax=Panagrolaimus sp. JU765 TaxID=591449 RepID=A0AC34RFE7_9BILA